MKALQSGCPVLSQMAGFFSAAVDVWPVMGAELVCSALAIADSNVSSDASGPTPGTHTHTHTHEPTYTHALTG